MNVLRPKNTVSGYTHRVFSLEEVYWQLDEAALLDPKFRSALAKSLDEHGMLWPPIVWTQETFLRYYEASPRRHDPLKPVEQEKTYRLAIGNNRFSYAQDKGYTHIECVVADEWQDKDDILKITQMEYRVDF